MLPRVGFGEYIMAQYSKQIKQSVPQVMAEKSLKYNDGWWQFRKG